MPCIPPRCSDWLLHHRNTVSHFPLDTSESKNLSRSLILPGAAREPGAPQHPAGDAMQGPGTPSAGEMC